MIVSDVAGANPIIENEKRPNGYEPGGGGVGRDDGFIALRLVNPPAPVLNVTWLPPVEGVIDSISGSGVTVPTPQKKCTGHDNGVTVPGFGQYVPAGQSVADVDPVKPTNDPAGAWVHDTLHGLAENVPAGQSVADVAPVFPTNDPAGD